MAVPKVSSAIALRSAVRNCCRCGQAPQVAGFPFRIDLSCRQADALGGRGQSLSLGGIKAAAPVYPLGTLQAEVTAPAILKATTEHYLWANWTRAVANATVTVANLKRLDVVVDDLNLKPSARVAGVPDLRIKRGAVHVRQDPKNPENADAAVTISGLSGLMPELGTLDLGLVLHLPGAGPLLSAGMGDYLLDRFGADTKIRIDRIYLNDPVVAVSAAGELVIDGRGLINGQVELTVVNPDQLASRIAGIPERQKNMLTSLQGTINAFGRPGKTEDGRPTKAISLKLADGVVRSGFLRIARIPPIFGEQ